MVKMKKNGERKCRKDTRLTKKGGRRKEERVKLEEEVFSPKESERV